MFTFQNGALFTNTYVWQANGVIKGGVLNRSKIRVYTVFS